MPETVDASSLSPQAGAAAQAAARQAARDIMAARSALLRGQRTMDGLTVDELLLRAQTSAESVANSLVRAGYNAPTKSASMGLDLSALATLDTAESHSLLSGMRQLLTMAKAVDRQRGNWIEGKLLPGETHGTDYAEVLGNLLRRLEREVEGSKGRD